MQSLNMRRGRGGGGHVGTRGVESKLISRVLHVHHLPLGGDEPVGAGHRGGGTCLLAGGSVIVGEIKVVEAILCRWTVKNSQGKTSSSCLSSSSLLSYFLLSLNLLSLLSLSTSPSMTMTMCSSISLMPD